MNNQVDRIGDRADMLSTTLREEVSHYTQLFQSLLPNQRVLALNVWT